jgi:hypothetical protein
MNGWDFWGSASGDRTLVSLSELRRRLRNGGVGAAEPARAAAEAGAELVEDHTAARSRMSQCLSRRRSRRRLAQTPGHPPGLLRRMPASAGLHAGLRARLPPSPPPACLKPGHLRHVQGATLRGGAPRRERPGVSRRDRVQVLIACGQARHTASDQRLDFLEDREGRKNGSARESARRARFAGLTLLFAQPRSRPRSSRRIATLGLWRLQSQTFGSPDRMRPLRSEDRASPN